MPVDVLPQQNHKVNNTKNKIENESRAEESDSLETMKVIVAENGNKSKKLSKTNERKGKMAKNFPDLIKFISLFSSAIYFLLYKSLFIL